ncbi:MAG TPA: vitamin B12-dependent ribonucleotide reductase [Acidobacteriaceae bacterium]
MAQTASDSALQSVATRAALTFKRHFSTADISPYDQVQWERRTAAITDAMGKTIFEQKDVEVPVDWSMTATNIVASKYLHGQVGTSERESGVRALVSRVAETVRDWGMAGRYFQTPEDAAIFHDELVHLLVNQKVAFNSPVWFNVGCDRLEPHSDAQNWHWNEHTCAVEFSVTGYRKPQCSACFINAVEDSLDSILTLAKTEGMLFKWGSGTGTNLSTLRGSTEQLSGGGTASGPLSFMRGFDAFAGVIKSGGKTRRAAKMVILNVEHPDILPFVECKMKEEAKAWALMREGYDGSSGPDSEAYSSIFFQNANNSVRVTDEFMHAVERDGEFSTRAVKDGAPVATYKAREIMHKIAEATWQCGDPGMQYDTTINRWHTSKNTARINASNPCSEYMFLDNSACNLASFNLMKFVDAGGTFDIESYRRGVDVMITAMDILIDNSGYPTEAIARNSHDYRPLGLGYANLGALLMAFGLPYDSDAGRDFAAALTAIMCGEAYLQSARLAEKAPRIASATSLTEGEREGGACPGFYVNREPFLDVIRMHRAEVNKIGKSQSSKEPFTAPGLDALIAASKDCWDKALAHGEKHGYRNAQVTVLAPTGTIGFMMDCDTTGIEPDLALVKYKKLVGGGMIKIVNNTVPAALFKLGYGHGEVDAIVSYIDATGTIEGAPGIKAEHLAVFDCSFKPSKGTRSILPGGHVKMMAATQPFLSGAISKTVNLPHDATVEDVADAYLESWRLGLKSVAIYRDGSKGAQPLNVSDGDKAKASGTGRTEAVSEASTAAHTLSETRILALEQELAALRGLAEASATSEQELTALRTAAALAAAAADPARSDLHAAQAPPRAVRHRLPDERASLTHKFSIGGHEGYITVGLYPSGAPGEIFIKMAKEGSTVSGLMDSFATAISLALQHGVPLKVLCEKFAHSRFEPSGWTGSETLGYAKSIMDYLFRWLELRFLSGTQLSLFSGLHPENKAAYGAGVKGAPGAIPVAGTLSDDGIYFRNGQPADEQGGAAASSQHLEQGRGGGSSPALTPDQHTPARGMGATSAPQGGIVESVTASASSSSLSSSPKPSTPRTEDRGTYHAADAMKDMYDMGDAPSCHTCGAIMVRNGSCYRCMSCGSTSGCS